MNDMELKQIDVKIVFLQCYYDEYIYMYQPQGFKVPSKECHVCLLKKSLYDLK